MGRVESENESENKKRLKNNFIYLFFLQGANYFLPLLTFPYLVKVLGVEYFGVLALATALVAYFGVVTDYGFNLTATKEISLYREDKKRVEEIFSAVMSIKFVLLLLSFLVLYALTLMFESLNEYQEVYLLTFGTIVGQVFFPVWFFQGMEQMKYITYLNLLSKAIFTLAIFIFVNEKEDLYLVPLFIAIGSSVAGFLALSIIYYNFKISFKFQSKERLLYYLKEGWHIFLSRLYVSIYSKTNTILLGVFTNNVTVGYYAIAEKIVLAIGGLFDPVNQALYPYLVRRYKENSKRFLKLIKKISLIFMGIIFILLFISEYFKDEIIFLIRGEENSVIVFLLSIYLFRLFVFPFGGLFSNVLIIMNRKKEFMKVMNYTVVLYILSVIPSIYFYGAVGLVISFIAILLAHVLLLNYYVFRPIQLEKEKK
jgi:PST family polysaccharide transporter